MSVIRRPMKLWEVEAFMREARERWRRARGKAEEEAAMADFRKQLSALPPYLLTEWTAAHGLTNRKLAEKIAGNIARDIAKRREEPLNHGELVGMVERELQATYELERIVAGVSAG
jgi:hypothetical protein